MKKGFSLLAGLLAFICLYAQNGVTVNPMPGFLNPSQLRYKNCIQADTYGKIWIGTRDAGLIIWDGSTWNYYDANNGISDQHVKTLAAGPNGAMWIGTDTGGVCFFDGFQWTNIYSNWNSPVPSNKITIIKREGTNVWIGTNRGLAKFDGVNWQVFTTQNSSLPGDTINDLDIDANGNLMVASSRGIIRYNGSNWFDLWQYNTNAAISKIYVHTDGSEWVLASNKIQQYNGTTISSIRNSFDFPPTINDSIVKEIGMGPNGGVAYTGAKGSLIELTGTKMEILFPNGMSNSAGLAYGIFCSTTTNTFWFVNSFTPNLIPPLNALMLFNHSQYNGLGEGINGSNWRFIDINQVKTPISDRGDMHWDLSANAYYHVPKSNNTSTIFASGFWIGGLDTGGNLHEACMTYRQQNGFDFWPGPIDPQTIQCDSSTAWKHDRVWKIDRYTISEFQWNFNQGNVQNGNWVVPYDLEHWPAIGNDGITEPLAPFVDLNGNGIYDPLTGGDYPFMKGDQELFCVMNDILAPHNQTHATALGIEVHLTVYAFVCDQATDSIEAINYTTFYDYEIINRSDTDYVDTKIGFYTDADLGNWQDDFIGCLPSYNFVFHYNGDSNDEPGQTPCYYNYPPIQSTVVLNGPLAVPNDSIDNNNNGNLDEPGEICLLERCIGFGPTLVNAYPFGQPEAPDEYYAYLCGIWRDSVPMTYGADGHSGTIPSRFIYPGLPSDTSAWTEISEGNTPSDRSELIITGTFNLASQDTAHYSIALVTSFDSVNTWNTLPYYQNMIDDVTRVQNWYANNQFPTCFALYNGVNETTLEHTSPIMLYPNPAAERITIEYEAKNANATIEIFDLYGKRVYGGMWNQSRMVIPVNGFATGLYFVRITDGDTVLSGKFLKD
jgi:Secretion system C-terminal sorting domain